MTAGKSDLRVPEGAVYTKGQNSALFHQLAVKVEMDGVSEQEYFAWLDETTERIHRAVPGAQIAEKENMRTDPPLNTAVYYDTEDYRILPTGALLRTSCGKTTHAFCAYKAVEDGHGIRRDHRHIFDGEEKRTLQDAPASEESVSIVRRLLARKDLEHPGTLLRREQGIDPEQLTPAVLLDDYRTNFFVWLDGKDALRCPWDRYTVYDLRRPEGDREGKRISEIELAIYPHISPEVAADPRVIDLITELTRSLCERFGTRVTKEIKYQRAAKALGLPGTR
ncbi:hypothetical protein [Kitasatospora sp. HPMI-4]|uniref:hypothetical protein n=1 Tax=Kitasatospora sp. HPMI-4 TaxID=3448443 RepID=UPI003F1964E7